MTLNEKTVYKEICMVCSYFFAKLICVHWVCVLMYTWKMPTRI